MEEHPMFSPLNDSKVEEWLARLNASLKRLPAQERAELHLEVRQHLDALVAANEELGSSPEEAWEFTLAQFGNPTKIGERLFLECQENRDGSRQGWSAIGLGIMLQAPGIMIPIVIASHFPNMFQSFAMFQSSASANVFLACGSVALTPCALGWKYPFHAIKGIFYAPFFWLFVFMCPELMLILSSHHAYVSPERVAIWAGHSSVTLDVK